MTRMEAMKKYGAPKQCPACRSCNTFERTDLLGTHHCLSCNHEWMPEPKPETVDERLDRLDAEYRAALEDDDVPAGKATKLGRERDELASTAMNTRRAK